MGSTPVPVEAFQQEYYEDNWLWDTTNCSPEVMLSRDSQAAFFHSNFTLESKGTAGVRGTKGFCDGEHYWEITFLEPPIGNSVMVGLGTKHATLHTDNYKYINLLGSDRNSWGISYRGTAWHAGKYRKFCEPFYDASTKIGVHLDLYKGTVSFYLNGESLGVAFTGLNLINEKLYPMISSTSVNTELEVGIRACRYLSLQEKCCLTIAKHLKTKEDISRLPLPEILKEHLKDLKSAH